MYARGDRGREPVVIREIYDSEYAHQHFAQELERALDAACPIILIEPPKLGDVTARWIRVGNCLHKTAVLSGLGSILASLVWPESPYVFIPLGGISLVCTGLYTASWQFDNCVKYQVETDPKRLAELEVMSEISPSSSAVLLIRKDDTRRKVLHCSVTFVAVALCAFRVYRTLQ